MKPGFGRLASLGEAQTALFERLPVLETETVSAGASIGRALASDIEAAIDVPHFARAAMDGYSVVASSTFGATNSKPTSILVGGAIAPGEAAGAIVTKSQCLEIGTGAVMPDGADAVAMVEFTESGEKDAVKILRPVAPGENVHQVGSDIKAGDVVLKKGTLLEPRHLGVLAAVGVNVVEVFRKPVVALFSTGAELLEPGKALQPGKIFDINSHTLEAALRLDGCEVTNLGVVADTAAKLESAVRRGLDNADLVLLSGGSSLGSGDLVQEVFEKVGVLLVHGVAVKPGKPLILAAVDDESGRTKMMIGLPGYPMSALSDYYIFVRPFLRKAMGVEGESPTGGVEAKMAHKQPSPLGRYEFLPVRLDNGKAYPLSAGSSSITAIASADGFIEIDERTEMVAEGETVLVRGF